MSTKIEPVIKWTGSKGKVASSIATLFPQKISGRYFEPFVGGGALLPYKGLATIGLAGDIIPELIGIWNYIKTSPGVVASEYEVRWSSLQENGYPEYYKIRDSFNNNRDPLDLLFLTRTCVNGLVRFNKKGDFNNSLHHTRPGINPSEFRKICYQWSTYIQKVEFVVDDYRNTLHSTMNGDVVFLDPPYGGTKGRYQPTNFDLSAFFNELDRLNSIGAKWILTFDGIAGSREYNTQVPRDLYQTFLPLPTGNSPFTKLMNAGIDAVVESVYLNFQPGPESIRKFAENTRQDSSIFTNLRM